MGFTPSLDGAATTPSTPPPSFLTLHMPLKARSQLMQGSRLILLKSSVFRVSGSSARPRGAMSAVISCSGTGANLKV